MKRTPILLSLSGIFATSMAAVALGGEPPAAVSQNPFDIGFVQNAGQWNREALFYASGPGVGVWVTSEGVKYDFYKKDPVKVDFSADQWVKPQQRSGHVVEMKFVGSSAGAKGVGTGRMPAPINFISGDGTNSAEVFEESRLIGLYGGIDLRLYRDKSYPRFDFIVAPGAQPSRIKFRFAGSDGLRPGPDGSLLVKTRHGEIPFAELEAYQVDSNGSRRAVSSKFSISNDGVVGFNVGQYDRSKPLVIDPIVYSTLLGAHAGDDIGTGIATDADGHPYVCGLTETPFYPITNGAYDVTVSGMDAFVTKFTPDAARLVYSTVIGGSGDDLARRIIVDGSGRAIIVGQTNSSNFPTTAGAFDSVFGGATEAFIARLSPTGGNLNYASYIGGGAGDNVVGLDQDADGGIYFAGTTSSGDLATTIGAFQPVSAGSSESFVGKIQSNGILIYLTYLGGSNAETLGNLAVTSNGLATVAGTTQSRGFPTTFGAFDRIWQQGDGYVTKLNQDGTGLMFSTFLGGSATESIANVALDRFGNVHVIGRTTSVDFPRTPGVLDNVFASGGENFLTKLAADGSVLLFSTFMVAGGGQGELRVDNRGLSYIVGNIGFPGSFLLGGETDDPDYNGPADPLLPGDGYLQVVNEAGNQIVYGSYIGAEQSEIAFGMHLDRAGNVYVTGMTNSFSDATNDGFPTTPGVFKPRMHNDRFPDTPSFNDAWLVKYKITRQSLISNFVCAPGNVAGTVRSRAGITLSQPAPAGGAFISIVSSDPNTARPIDATGLPISNMFIDQGATTGGFLIETTDVVSPRSVRFTITLEQEQRSADLVVRPWLQNVVLTPIAVVGGNQVRGVISLFQGAPADGMTISAISSDPTKATVVVGGEPTDSLEVPAGINQIPFIVETTGVDENPASSDGGWGIRFKFKITSPALNLELERTIRVMPARLIGLTVEPGAVAESNAAVGRIVLDGETGPSGLPVKVRATSQGSAPVSFPEADIDGNLLVPSGVSIHPFTVQAGGVTSDNYRVISASGGRQPSEYFARLNVLAFSVLALEMEDTEVPGGAATSVRVRMSRTVQGVTPEISLRLNPPTGTSAFAELESNTATVPSGSVLSDPVAIQTFPTLIDRSVTVQAYRSGMGSATATLLVRGTTFTFQLTPSVVIGGEETLDGRIELSIPARPGGVEVFIASADPAIIPVPASVTVPVGQTVATFKLNPVRVPSSVDVQVTATMDAVPDPRSVSRTITVKPRRPNGAALEFDPASVLGGLTSIGKVTLDGPAPAAGTVVKLTKDGTTGGAPYVTIPGQITIPVNQTQGTFTVKTIPPPGATSVRIFAQAGTKTVSAILTLTVIDLDAFTIDPGEVLGGDTAVGTLTLDAPAGPGGRKVLLSVKDGSPGAPYVSFPAEVKFSQGVQTAKFKVLTVLPPENTVATIVASVGTTQLEANLVITAPQLSSLTITPSTVVGGSSATGEVFLDKPAPIGGAIVQLVPSSTSTGTAFTSFPSQVTIPAGQTSVKFAIKTTFPSRTVATTIIASYSQNSVSAVITITR